MKKNALLIFLVVFSSCVIFGQGTSGSSAKYEYRNLIDMPSAGIMNRGFSAISIDVMPAGVVVSKMEVGVFDGISFGISYGGGNVIGTGKIDWYKLPGINIRARVLDESEALPAFTLGFDSQGKGYYDRNLNRYEIKSQGFFVAASKNFELFGYLSVHGAINYSLERDDSDKDLNLSVGAEKTIGSKFSVIAEYNVAFNDNHDLSLGKGNGYLNFGARWSVGDGLTLGLNLRDLLKNKRVYGDRADRGIYVEYVKGIF